MEATLRRAVRAFICLAPLEATGPPWGLSRLGPGQAPLRRWGLWPGVTYPAQPQGRGDGGSGRATAARRRARTGWACSTATSRSTSATASRPPAAAPTPWQTRCSGAPRVQPARARVRRRGAPGPAGGGLGSQARSLSLSLSLAALFNHRSPAEAFPASTPARHPLKHALRVAPARARLRKMPTFAYCSARAARSRSPGAHGSRGAASARPGPPVPATAESRTDPRRPCAGTRHPHNPGQPVCRHASRTPSSRPRRVRAAPLVCGPSAC